MREVIVTAGGNFPVLSFVYLIAAIAVFGRGRALRSSSRRYLLLGMTVLMAIISFVALNCEGVTVWTALLSVTFIALALVGLALCCANQATIEEKKGGL